MTDKAKGGVKYEEKYPSERGINHFEKNFDRLIAEILAQYKKSPTSQDFNCNLYLGDIGTETFKLELDILDTFNNLGFIKRCEIIGPKEIQEFLEYIPPTPLDIESGIHPNSSEEMEMQRAIEERNNQGSIIEYVKAELEINAYEFTKYLRQYSRDQKVKIIIHFDGDKLFMPSSIKREYPISGNRKELVSYLIDRSKISTAFENTSNLANLLNKDSDIIRSEIKKINRLVYKRLLLQEALDFIEGLQNSGYRINPVIRVIKIKD